MKEKQKQTMTPERMAELVERARTGDQDAYTALYEATSQEVYRTVRSMLRGEETALDIQQDAYVYAFTHLDQLGDPTKFSTWLHSIAVNRTYSVLRKQTPLLFTELESEEGAGLPEVADLSPEASPELHLERQETAAYIREILDSLTAGQRMLVGMYYYEQLPVGKIAEDLGVTPGTVKTQLFRSRKKIEAAVRCLEEKGVKLFGLAPLPFLIALLKKLTPAAEQSRTVMTGALTRAGVAPAAQAAAVQVGARFFQTTLGHVVLGVIAAAAIGGGVAGYNWFQSHANYGDIQPPTETFEINLQADSDEDLTTEPTEEVTLPTDPETNEDLIPEPTEEETTEPTDPTETTEPTDPAPQPTDPTDPTNPAGPGDPTDPEPTPPPVTTTAAPPRLTFYDEVSTLEVGKWMHYHVNVKGDAVPVLYTDHPEVLKIEAKGQYSGGSVSGGETGYFWYVEALEAGEANLYCVLDGETRLVSSVIVPLPPIDWNPNMPPVDDTIIDFEEETEP